MRSECTTLPSYGVPRYPDHTASKAKTGSSACTCLNSKQTVMLSVIIAGLIIATVISIPTSLIFSGHGNRQKLAFEPSNKPIDHAAIEEYLCCPLSFACCDCFDTSNWCLGHRADVPLCSNNLPGMRCSWLWLNSWQWGLSQELSQSWWWYLLCFDASQMLHK